MLISWTIIGNSFVVVITLVNIAQAGNNADIEVWPNKCGRRLIEISSKIVGGTKSRPGRHPWMATLFYNKKSKMPQIPGCGGSILNKNHILTAGHCCNLGGFPPVYVRVGEFDLRKTYHCGKTGKCKTCAQDLTVNVTKPHPEYKVDYRYGWARNDICIVRLNRNIRFNKYVQPICFPKADTTNIQIGTEMEFAGFGKTENGSSEVLNEATLSLISAAECDAQLPPVLRHNSSSEFCAQGENLKACVGDSGGALVHRGETGMFYVWGVASYSTEDMSDPECRDGKPVVFTRVDKYRKWVEESIGP